MIDRDRIALIKRLHLGLEVKPEPVRKKRIPAPSGVDPSIHYAIGKKEYQQKKREAGMCRSCRSQAVTLFYVHDGLVLLETKCKYCPKCWENRKMRERLNALPIPA